MIRKLRQLSKLRDEYIEGAEKRLLRGLSKLEKDLLDRIFNTLIDQFSTNRGVIIYNNQNFGLLPALDKIIEEFRRESYLELFRSHTNDYLEISNQVNSYFKIQVKDSQFKRLENRVTKLSLRSVGLKQDGEVIRGGFLENLYLSDQLNTEIKTVLIKNITSSSKLSELRKELIDNIVTTKQRNGLLRRHWRQHAFDTQQRFNRNHSNVWADEVGITAFEYSPGRVGDTRVFCTERIGKVFLKDELSEWNGLVNKKEVRSGKRVFVGPIVANASSYNPARDVGGINCQHTLNPISDDLAVSIDSTLEVVDGELKRK